MRSFALPGVDSEGAWTRVGDGSEHLMHAMARAFISPGDEVIEPHPSFGLMSRYAAELGARAVRTPLTPDYVYDLDAICRGRQ